MRESLEEIIRDMNRQSVSDTGNPAHLYERLKLVAALLRTASDASAAGPRLLWREADGQVRSEFIDRPLTIGRSSNCEVLLADRRVSSRHCRVSLTDDGVLLEDLQSTNGTVVNAVRLDRRLLRAGDVIQIGSCPLVFVD